MKKKICVITSSRADFGLLKNLLKKLNLSFDLKLVVTGTHLHEKFGYTKNFITQEKIKIFKSIKIYENNNFNNINETYILKTISKTIVEFDKIYKKIKPKLIIVLGDRYEIFASVISANINRLPVAHIHGGETTSNALDDAFRHCITQLSQLHFVAAKKYYNRVIQLGKNPINVHLVGGLGPSNIKSIKKFGKKKILQKYGLNNKKPYLILIYHSETLEKNYGILGIKNILKVLSKFKDMQILVSLPNADTNSNKVLSLINNHTDNIIKKFKSIDYDDFISLMKYSCFIIGNSSSGIIEAPSLKIPTINVGNRQHGRLRAISIIDTNYQTGQIERSVKLAMSKKFKNKLKNLKNPYYHGDSIKKIVNIIKKIKSFEYFDKIEFFNLKKIK